MRLKQIYSRSGQVVVEYLLIMSLVVAIAATLTKVLVGRGEGSSQGLMIKSWSRMIKVIGNDLPDCPKQSNFSEPTCPTN